jgi:hypothetical protein
MGGFSLNIDTYVLIMAIIAGAMHVIAFAIYNWQMLKGKSTPNTVTWTLWVFLTVMNVFSYLDMSGNLVKSILPVASSAACVATFLFVLSKKKFEKFEDWEDYAALVTGLIAGFVWWYFHSSEYANYVLQIAITISFYPTIKGVKRNPKKEKGLPWYIWSGGYVFMIVAVCFNWNGQYKELVYPVNCLWLHAVVGILTLRNPSIK